METNTAPKYGIGLSHRVAIRTKYLAPTNGGRGSRVKAYANGHSVTVSWDYSLDTAENHALAVEQFVTKMEWEGMWTLGATDNGYVAVWTGL